MTTAHMINELNALTIRNSGDYAPLDRLEELTAQLVQKPDGQLACAALLGVLERRPQVEFGAPGPLVHTLESYPGHYETLLLASLERQPTAATIWLLNRMINAATAAEKRSLLARLHHLATHPHTHAAARAEAESFYRFQTEKT